jgi:ABC-2 type transport system ATP-binding protein
MEEADELCNRLAIIDHGHLLALGTPDELKRSTGADTVVSVSATGDLDALAALLRSGVPNVADVTRVDGTVVVATREQEGLIPTVFNLAERNGFSISDVSINEPTLENVFINLTGKDLRE